MMDFQVYEDVKQMLHKELERISKMNELNDKTLDDVCKIMKSLKNIEEISHSNGEMIDTRNSNRYLPPYYYMDNQNYNDNRNSYDNYMNPNNRYMNYYENNNSRHSLKESTIENLEQMLNTSNNNEERRILLDCISDLKRYN